jgi:hypothetical protein
LDFILDGGQRQSCGAGEAAVRAAKILKEDKKKQKLEILK